MFRITHLFAILYYKSSVTAGSHYCCTAQDSLNGDQLTAQFEVIWKNLLEAESIYRKSKLFKDINQEVSVSSL